MPPSLVRKTLRDDRRMIIGWVIGLIAFMSLYLSFYNAAKNGLLAAKMDMMPAAMRELVGWGEASFAVSYLDITVYSLLGPLLVITATAVLGTRMIAGAEDGHIMDLLLANPIGRRRFVLERFAALATAVVVIGLVPWLVFLTFAGALNMGVAATEISAASLGLLLLGLLFGTLALAVGAAVGRRGVTLAVTGAVAIAGYSFRVLAQQVTGLGWLRWLSPFHYYQGDNPLQAGFNVGYLLVLAALTVMLVVVAAVAFERRDTAA